MKKLLFLLCIMNCALCININAQRRVAYTAKTADRVDFQVFNDAKKGGFVIVAPKEVLGEEIVLGYTDFGTFDYDKAPENLKWWLSEYQRQINELREEGNNGSNVQGFNGSRVKNLRTLKKRDVRTAAPRPIVAPLLGENNWEQTAPFNNYCPVLDAKRSVVGCVATSTSQVMSYWSWPLKGKGTASYYWNEGKTTLSANLADSTYNWELIKPDFGDCTKEQGAEYAKLCSSAGIALHMGYSPESSGAYSEDISTVIVKNFNYKTPNTAYRYSYTAISWENILRNDLDKLHPICYAGRGSYGHAFVCDGYDDAGYFHFNFGWAGYGDGYYLSTLKEQDFSQNQYITYNITPNRTQSSVDGLYYNILNDNAVEVAFPESAKVVYQGNITIPSTVTISGKTYNVVRIGSSAFRNSAITGIDIPATIKYIPSGAFTGCTALKSVTVHGDDLLNGNTKIFDKDIYSQATLNIADGGTLEKYAAANPWRTFCTIKDASQTQEWTSWEPAKDGTCTCTYNYEYFASSPLSSPIFVRYLKSDETQCQYLIENYSCNSSLIIDVDQNTNQCKVKKVKMGFVYTQRSIYASDYPNRNSSYTYKSYPCTFNPETGEFLLNMSYYYSTGGALTSGKETVKIDGYPNYSIELTKVEVDKEGNVKGTVNVGDGSTKIYYLIEPRVISLKEDVQALVDKVNSGEITPKVSTSSTINDVLSEAGNYTLVVMSVSPSGKAILYDFKAFKYTREAKWVERYTGTYTYSVWEKQTQNNVTAYQDEQNPAFWRLFPMYGNTEFLFTLDEGSNQIDFDLQTTAFVYKNKETTVQDYKTQKSTAKASYYDPEKQTFNFDTYYVSGNFKEYGFEVYQITGSTGINDVEANAKANANGVYNLAGQKVGNDYKGVVISNGKKIIRK